MKVKLLEKIGSYEKGDIMDMRDDLVKGVFKDKVEVLEKENKVINTAKNKAILKPKNTKGLKNKK